MRKEYIAKVTGIFPEEEVIFVRLAIFTYLDSIFYIVDVLSWIQWSSCNIKVCIEIYL